MSGWDKSSSSSSNSSRSSGRGSETLLSESVGGSGGLPPWAEEYVGLWADDVRQH